MSDVISISDKRFKSELSTLADQILSGEVADPIKSVREIASRHGIDQEKAIVVATKALEGKK